MLTLTTEHIVIVCLAVVATAAIVAWFFRKDTEQEGRLRGYGEVSAWAKEAKLKHTAAIFSALNVKDFSGLAKEILILVDALKESPEKRLKLLDENFFWQLDQRVKLEADWPKILAVVQAHADAKKAAAGRALQAQKQAAELPPAESVPAAAGSVS